MIRERYTVGHKVIEVYIPKQPSYAALENLYDVCNELFMEDCYSDCFYTKDDVANLKKDSANTFLRRSGDK